MISIVLIVFFLFLIIGVPIAHTVMIASTVGAMGGGSDATIVIQQLFEGLNSYTLLAVPFFIISGNIAANGNTSSGIVNTINAFLGRFKGGLGIATIFACVFFGAVTGSAIATVVAIGALMLPQLLERGYPRGLCLGIITASGTLGVMIPPSIAMLLVSVAMGSSVSKQFLAGFLPGLITALGFSLYTWYRAKRLKIPVEPAVPFFEKLRVVKKSIWALMFPVIILGGIYSGVATPTEAAIISVFYVLLVELLIYKTMTIKQIFTTIKDSIVSAAVLTITVATARVFVWYLTTQRIPTKLFNFIIEYIDNGYTLLFCLVLLFIIAGCFVEVSSVVIILGPVLLNVLNHFDINLIHFGIIAIMCAQIGFISPPYGICLFVSMKVGKASLVEVIRGTAPFLIIMVLCTALFIMVPEISLFLPNLFS
ncbi:TRAP transporter large permease [Anaerotruncus rubiinfantis]|uniref:TRAP transporter large permease n=1 Tax=Anaerotruncus rubiinfantis TaxID=1720200 RepID=UPI0008363B45|nr:TRAP transporter large permease [Anaerotruncus rubiinfantis]